MGEKMWNQLLWTINFTISHEILSSGKSSSSFFYYLLLILFQFRAKTIYIDIMALYFSLTPIPSNINPCLPIFVRGFATVWKIPHEISTAATAFQIEIS